METSEMGWRRTTFHADFLVDRTAVGREAMVLNCIIAREANWTLMEPAFAFWLEVTKVPAALP